MGGEHKGNLDDPANLDRLSGDPLGLPAPAADRLERGLIEPGGTAGAGDRNRLDPPIGADDDEQFDGPLLLLAAAFAGIARRRTRDER